MLLLLGWAEHAPWADCREGQALVEASAVGHLAVVRLLLGWGEHAPRADCQGGHPLLMAMAGRRWSGGVGGHVQVMRCLQEAINNLTLSVNQVPAV